MYRLFLLFMLGGALILGCGKDNQQAEIDRNLILDFLNVNNLNAIEDESGLFYIVDVPGGEEKPSLSDSVQVTYEGFLLDGTRFDGTQPGMDIKFKLSGVIEGWQIGIAKFGRGGSGTLLIPSALGYGNQRVGTIPANSVLLFDVALLDFHP